ncbi:MAG TPA: ABC transporter permease [Chloroflexia bacterium]|nr:ABC transporter permease [Chloroflexia bacterium]
MNLLESFKIALSSLASNKLRALLTMLGIIIGVGAVIALQSIGAGVVDASQKRLTQNGTNLITIQPATQTVGGVAQQTTNSNLTYEDALAMQDQTRITKALAVAPEYRSGGQLVYNSRNTFGQAVGTTEDYPAVRDLTVADGDWFTTSDVDQTKPVVVLGATVATELFDQDEPVGKNVRLNRVQFTVVGVLAAKGGTGFGSLDNQIYVPISAAQKMLFGRRQQGATSTGSPVTSIVAKAVDQDSVDQLISQITDLLRERHKISGGQQDDFQVVNQQDLLQAAKDQAATYTIFLLVIASISLFVGGIGIMNIMLVTVTERTREIGIRKAIGAKPFDILLQFMIESITICLMGGLIGVVLGVAAALIVGNTVPQLPTLISPSIVVIAVAFAVAVGLFFGIYPARRASKLNPIDALRYE